MTTPELPSPDSGSRPGMTTSGLDNPASPEAGSVVIIGGGIIGTACAEFLVQRGLRVTVVEKEAFGTGTSYGNCGLVCPSHVLPLAEPGAIQQALRSLFDPQAAFRVRPRLDFSLWSWMWQFARRCTGPMMLESATGIQPLLHSSLSLYEQLIAEQQLDCEWEKRGLLFVYRSPQALHAYEPTNRLLAEQFGEPARCLTGEELLHLEPSLQPGLAGAWYYEHDGHLRPDRLMSSWRTRLQQRGVRFIEQCEVRGFQTDSSIAGPSRQQRLRGLRTTQGELLADRFVVACGALSPRFAKELGCRIPIQPGKGYSLTVARPEPAAAVPMILPERRVAITPWGSGLRLGSIMEFAGYDSTIRPERLALLTSAAREYLRPEINAQIEQSPLQDRWYGWRPMTYDSQPIIDRVPAFSNVWLAAGHNMLGLSMAPATGRLVAELMLGEQPHINPQPYSSRRF